MRRLAFIAFAASLALAGCATAPGPGGGVPAVTVGTLDEKALWAAEAAYNIPAQAYVAALETGSVTPAMRARMRPALQAAKRALDAARAAFRIGDALTYNAQLATARRFAAEARTLLPTS